MVPKRRDREEAPFVRQLIVACALAIVIGVAVFLMAWLTRDVSLFGDIADSARDETFALRAGEREPVRLHAPIVFVNIDDASMGNRPRDDDVFPRDRLAAMLEKIVADKPRMILADIDLGVASQQGKGDAALNGALETIGRAGTQLLLVRGPNGIGANGAPDRFNTTPFDAMVKGYPTLHWVSAQALRGAGGVARRIRSGVNGCVGDTPLYFPSAGRAAAALYSGDTGAGSRAAGWRCNGGTAKEPPVDLVSYTLRWPGRDGPSQQTVIDGGGIVLPLVSVVPAAPLLDANSGQIATQLFRGAIVVIGESYKGAQDEVFHTPLDDMPGSFMLVNYLRGLIDFGNEPDGSLVLNLLLTVAVSLATALIMVLADEGNMRWVELLLPLAVIAAWWIALSFGIGSGEYFGFGLAPFVVGIAVFFRAEIEKIIQKLAEWRSA